MRAQKTGAIARSHRGRPTARMLTFVRWRRLHDRGRRSSNDGRDISASVMSGLRSPTPLAPSCRWAAFHAGPSAIARELSPPDFVDRSEMFFGERRSRSREP